MRARRELKLLGGASVGMLTVVIVLMFAASSAVPHYAMRSKQVAAVVSAVLADLANGDRVSNNLATLRINPILAAAAQAKADDMATKGYFAHTAPDGTDPWHWFQKAGYEYDYAGENLAIDFSDSGDVERAWMQSPAHRENILNMHFTEIGIATAVGMYQGRQTVFVVQEFGSPSKALATEGTPAGTYTTRTQPATAVVPANPSQLAIATVQRTPIAKAAKIENRQVLGTSVQEVTQVLGRSDLPKGDQISPELAQNATRKAVEDAAPVAAINPSPAPTAQKPPLWAYIIGVPHEALRYSYYMLGVFILLTLAFTTRFEMRKHHLRHATGAGFLIGLMGVLLIVAHYTIFAEPILAAVISH